MQTALFDRLTSLLQAAILFECFEGALESPGKRAFSYGWKVQAEEFHTVEFWASFIGTVFSEFESGVNIHWLKSG